MIRKILITITCLSLLQSNLHAHESTWNLSKPAQKAPVAIKTIANHYKLVFFFAGYCGYCHKFAPIVKEITEEYGFDLTTYSFDGHAIKTLKEPIKANNSHIEKYFDDVPLALPLLVAESIKGNRRIILTQGLTTKENILDQLTQCPI